MKYFLLGFGSLCLLWSCEQMDIPIDPIDPISGCEGEPRVRDNTQLPILYDSSSYVLGTIDGKPFRPSYYRMMYRNEGLYYNVHFAFEDSLGCEWFRFFRPTVNSDHAWYREVGDTIFLNEGAHIAIKYREDNRWEYFTLDIDSKGSIDNFATIHSISEDTIIEGSLYMKLMYGFTRSDSIVTIKVDRFRLKPTF